MAIFAISDLHLPLGIDKPMDIFGAGWDNYVEKIEREWKKSVKETDFVIINGDFSWATYLDEALPDFKFIESLPGKKILSKGNHDYWWETISKMDAFLEKNDIKSVSFMKNNAYLCDGISIAGTKGSKSPTDASFKAEDMKIYNRELIRFETSIKEAKELSDKVVACLHYPPDEKFLNIIDKYNVERCIFGHLHGNRAQNYEIKHPKCTLVSADFLKFKPFFII